MSVMSQCDKMKLLLGSLLLSSLYTLSSWSVSSTATFVVTQFPPNVTIMEGETVDLLCCWSKSSHHVSVNWLKTMMNDSISFKVQHEGSVQNKPSNCSTLIFSNITTKDAGRYICKVSVEIPIHLQAHGSGTAITVMTNDKTSDEDGRDHPGTSSITVIVSLAVLAPLLLITPIVFCLPRMKRDCTAFCQEQAARVIYEVLHVDSEEMEMDKHSSTSSSRGSSQWCQVLVYESFDYFEPVETEKSG